MRIGIIDADLMDHGTRHPNLALMKIAGYFLEKGNEVKLIFESYEEVTQYDEIYMSKVFSFSKVPDWVVKLDNIHIGGTGFYPDGGENLPDQIEHHMPYYDLYKEYVESELAKGKKRQNYSDYLDYSIGFTTRGCFRKCSFCVNKKYDHAFRHSSVAEFYDESRPAIYLWDDNILAYPQWETVLDELEAIGKPFQFRQGIDIRLMTDRKAKRFNSTHYHGDFIFAFDHYRDRDIIIEKVQLWKRYSAKVCKMYVISAYDSQDEEDIRIVFERIKILMQYGSLPYIMRYEAYKDSPYKGMYIQLARWCNQPQFFKKKSFREFCVANQEYKKNQETNCSAYQTMLDFEQKFPEIANQYFDLKFETENLYAQQYGYGRKYANKPHCQNCKQKGVCWDLLNIDHSLEEFMLQLYFTKEIDLECLRYRNAECDIDAPTAANYLLDILKKYSINEIIELLKNMSELEEITKDNIPQISNLPTAFIKVAERVNERALTPLSYSEIGELLDPVKKNEGAHKKYGENHAKLAALMDLVCINSDGKKVEIRSSQFGKEFVERSEEEKEIIAVKLCLRIPIIQRYYLEECNMEAVEEGLSILSETTRKRRRSSIIDIIQLIDSYR